MKRVVYILSTMLIMGLVMNTCGAAFAFTDVRGHWARPQIDYLQSRDMVSGYPDHSFKPGAFITRAEFTTLLISFLNATEEANNLTKGESSFGDVPNDHWAKGYIELAKELGIVSGDERGNYKPYLMISREEAIVMLVNALKVTNIEEPEDLPYSDYKDISAWAIKAVSYAADKGLVQGYPDGSFKPQNRLTRAEVTVLLEHLLDMQGRKFHFAGTLVDINLPLKEMTIRLAGEEEVFTMTDNLAVYREGSVEPVNELVLPADIMFNVNNKGELTFVYLVEKFPVTGFKFSFSSLLESSRMVSVDSRVVKLSEVERQEVNVEVARNNPALSMETTKDAMRVQDFVRETGATGRGQLVAIIDSGVDMGHPDLQKTTDGYIKIVDFVDLTDEGKVSLNGPLQPENGQLTIGELKVDVTEINNAAGEFYYGYLGTSFLPPVIKDNLAGDRFLVVVSASQYFNNFDTVYIDTNMDGQIKDEAALQKYGRSYKSTAIKGQKDKVFNLVVSEIDKDIKYVKFGFDSLGHGTEVAGIVAAYGQVEGVAPGAQILPIKVFNSLGLAYLNRLESAIMLAADMGANVAVLSMGQYQISPAELKQLSNLANRMWNAHGMLLCIAAGNNGPGLGTVANTAAIQNVISVGAYATPEMWRNDYGWDVEKPTLWYFSSSGPGMDGITAPVLVAPGSVISTYPLWGDSMYHLDEGTSMAAPHVAGAAALLLDVMSHKMYIMDSMVVSQGLIAGAMPLEGYEAVEQGFGAIDMVRAWQEIKKVKDQYVNFRVNQYSPDFGYGNGYYSKEIIPAELSVKISNNSGVHRSLAVGGLSNWIKPQQFSVQVPAGGERTITVRYDDFNEPGLYSDFLVADDFDTPGWDVAVLQTVVVPYDLQNLPKQMLEQQDEVGAGEFKRYFVNVPEGTENLDVKLLVGTEGRARMHIISPVGLQDVSQYAGVGATATSADVGVTYPNPAPGTWEIVVYSSATIGNFDLKVSKYTLQAGIGKVIREAPKAPEKRYLVTAYPPKHMLVGEQTEIVLHFWDAATKTPATGIVTINGKLYEIKQGLVKVGVVPDGGELTFNIAW